jgi:hypothetical protein
MRWTHSSANPDFGPMDAQKRERKLRSYAFPA